MAKGKSLPRKSPAKRALRKVERTDLKVTRKVSIAKADPVGKWTRRFAEIGDQPPLVAISLGVIAAGIVGGHERLRRTGFRMLTAHSLSSIAKLAGKDHIDRTRPGALNEKAYKLERGTSRDGRLRSMPSGHSAGIVAIAGAIAADYPRALIPAAVASVAVGAAQVPSRNHYLSDVIVGAGIGFAVAGLARLLIPPRPAGA
ncbi:MAG: phosphatase PAP2 family protein [Sphingomonas bacterium]|nr:phosphatase PAP2 family protein [Sphingomonas bacterium]